MTNSNEVVMQTGPSGDQLFGTFMGMKSSDKLVGFESPHTLYKDIQSLSEYCDYVDQVLNTMEYADMASYVVRRELHAMLAPISERLLEMYDKEPNKSKELNIRVITITRRIGTISTKLFNQLIKE